MKLLGKYFEILEVFEVEINFKSIYLKVLQLLSRGYTASAQMLSRLRCGSEIYSQNSLEFIHTGLKFVHSDWSSISGFLLA